MTDQKPTTTLGESLGLVSDQAVKDAQAATLAVEAERDAALKRVTRLESDLAAEKSIRNDREKGLTDMANKLLEHEATRQLAVTEACKAKSAELGYKRKIATMEEANAALSREVDQLRAKGAELWASLVSARETRDVAVKERIAAEETADAALTEVETLRTAVAKTVEAAVVATTMASGPTDAL
ncbi:MAG: hypothetical protein PHX83_07060 [Acidobacteriia bacterium]|nr:hypothetical protein [Terriglobia bacterium]